MPEFLKKIFKIMLCFCFNFIQQDIQFKVHSKYQLFNVNAATPNFNGIDLLATASNFGLVIVGRPASTEIEGLHR